jgi:HSP20 family protein
MSVTVKKSMPTAKAPAETKGVPAPSDAEQHPLLSLRQEVDNLFDNFFSNFSLGPFGRRAFEFDPFRRFGGHLMVRDMMPSMDIRESDKEFHLTAELPGMDEGDIEVTLSDGMLVIKGEKKEEKSEKGENMHLTERRYGSIYRSLPLPEGIDENKVDAHFARGVLEISMKKKPNTVKPARKVKIKGE